MKYKPRPSCFLNVSFCTTQSWTSTQRTFCKHRLVCTLGVQCILTNMDYPHRVTCIFLSTKVENSFISLEDFTKKIPKVDPSMILDLEFCVSQSIKFNYQLNHPYLSLYGLCLDAQVCCSVVAIYMGS
jgi:hypothetical protein